jgi:hypothetical protein
MVTITWDDRTSLLAEMKDLDALAPVIREFENAGATRPVKIPQELKPALVRVIEMWGQNTPGGLAALPEGIFELRNDLADELAGT